MRPVSACLSSLTFGFRSFYDGSSLLNWSGLLTMGYRSQSLEEASREQRLLVVKRYKGDSWIDYCLLFKPNQVKSSHSNWLIFGSVPQVYIPIHWESLFHARLMSCPCYIAWSKLFDMYSSSRKALHTSVDAKKKNHSTT